MVVMMKGVPSSVPQTSGKVDPALVEKAVDSLLKWNVTQKQREKAQLLEDDELLYVVVGMNKVPEKGRTNPYRVELPHPLYDKNHEVCLFISDRATAKDKLDRKTAKERIEKEGLRISKVIPLSKLKTDYFAFEAKRKLCGSYDMFLADDRILGELPKLLGKAFYKKKKHPIPVNLRRAQWTGQITSALNSTFVYVSGGTCSVVKVARVSQSRDEIVENVKAVVEGVAQQVPKKWANIRAFFLKTLESIALPLYQSLPIMPLKIELPELPQTEVKKSLKLSKKAKLLPKKSLGSSKKAKVALKNEGDGIMDVVEELVIVNKSEEVAEEPVVAEKAAEVLLAAEKVIEELVVAAKAVEELVVAEKSKKRKQNSVESRQKLPRKVKAGT